MGVITVATFKSDNKVEIGLDDNRPGAVAIYTIISDDQITFQEEFWGNSGPSCLEPGVYNYTVNKDILF